MCGIKQAVYVLSFLLQFDNISTASLSKSGLDQPHYIFYVYACSFISIVLYTVLFLLSCCQEEATKRSQIMLLTFVVILQFGIASVFVVQLASIDQDSSSSSR